MRVELKGIRKVTAKGKTYWYAWRGGPRLRGQPGSAEFHQSFNEAIESRRTPEPGRFKSLVTLYKASNDYRKLAVSTRKSSPLRRVARRLRPIPKHSTTVLTNSHERPWKPNGFSTAF